MMRIEETAEVVVLTIGTILIQMSPEGMPEGVTGQTFWPAKFFFVGSDMSGKEKGIDRPRRVCLFREKPSCGPAAFEPVLCEDVESGFREDRISVTTVLAMGDMDAHVFALDIFISKAADFPDAKAGGIHKSGHSFMLDIGHGGNECYDFLPGRDKGKVSVEPSHRDLRRVSGFMKDVKSKETDLRDGGIDCPVRKGAFLLQDIQEFPDLRVSDLGRVFMKRIRDKIEISRDIGTIRLHGMSSKATKRDHLFIEFKIIHRKPPERQKTTAAACPGGERG